MAELIVAWDPGDTTGVAVFTEDGKFLMMDQCAYDSIPAAWKYIEATYGKITKVIAEDFVLFGHRAKKQAGSRMKASQVIGSLRVMADLAGSEFILQQASIKGPAKKSSGVTVPSDHSQSHQWDAYLHGYYYLWSNKVIDSRTKKAKINEQR